MKKIVLLGRLVSIAATLSRPELYPFTNHCKSTRAPIPREHAPLKGTTYHRKVPKTDADRVRCALAAERREERGRKRYGWAIASNANQGCPRSRVRLDMLAACT